MVVFDVNNLNAGAWFDYADGRVKVRAFSRDILEETREKFTKRRIEYKRINKVGQQQRFEYFDSDDKAIKEALWDFAIVDWEGFADTKGKALPCTKATKIKLMSGDPVFYEFIDSCIVQLTEDEGKRAETSEKN